MKVSEDIEKLDRVIKVYNQAIASLGKVLRSRASDVEKVELSNKIVLQADKKVGNILHAQKIGSSR